MAVLFLPLSVSLRSNRSARVDAEHISPGVVGALAMGDQAQTDCKRSGSATDTYTRLKVRGRCENCFRHIKVYRAGPAPSVPIARHHECVSTIYKLPSLALGRLNAKSLRATKARVCE